VDTGVGAIDISNLPAMVDVTPYVESISRLSAWQADTRCLR